MTNLKFRHIYSKIIIEGDFLKEYKKYLDLIRKHLKDEKVELDITDASKIQIRVKSTGWNDYNYINMFDACLYK